MQYRKVHGRRDRKCGPILRSVSSRKRSGTSESMGITKNAEWEPGGPHVPGSSNELIHQRVVSWAMMGPRLSLRSIILAAVRTDGRGEASAGRAMEPRLIQGQWEDPLVCP